ncbi:hypothetical protein C3497_06435 [Zoogloeaceae bacteirum Par-f-2]|nr:hypothetical protein C3497_06435 [Zoogloeaceae bacteirum Par-f-2]
MHAPLNARFATVLSRWFFQRHQSVLLHHRRSPEVNSGAATIGDSALTGNYGVARTVTLLDTLNMTVFRQQREIERLQKQVLALDGQVRSLVAIGQPASVRDEIPPHY